MATTQKTSAPDQRIVLYDVSWGTYESLLANYKDKSSPRFTYDRGVLEIVSPTTRHERIIYVLTTIVTMTALEQGNVVDGVGSMTFKHPERQQGFEPDASFYIQHAAQVADSSQIELAVDPPPDLVVEIDIANSSLNKLPIFAAARIPEVWRNEAATGKVMILRLHGEKYERSAESGVLPPLTADALSRFVTERVRESGNWVAEFQAWLRCRQ
jgi:Uma2 family endonuclease